MMFIMFRDGLKIANVCEINSYIGNQRMDVKLSRSLMLLYF